MEYGIFSDPAFNWTLIGTSIFCAILFISLVLFYNTTGPITNWMRGKDQKRYEKKRALWDTRVVFEKNLLLKILERIHKSDTFAGIWYTIAICSFIAIWSLLGAGLWKGGVSASSGCYAQKYASQGTYEIIDAKLVFDYNWKHTPVTETDPILKKETETKKYGRNNAGNLFLIEKATGNKSYIRTYTPGHPQHFELRLRGRPNSSSPTDFTAIRCIRIPYNEVSDNINFTPKPSVIQNASPPEPMPVHLPKYTEKYGDKWWKFSEEVR
jgi:hypothetical protein